MKKLSLFVLAAALAVLLCACNKEDIRAEEPPSGVFDVTDFLTNPFTDKQMFPMIFDNYEELQNYFKNNFTENDFSVNEEDVKNRYDNSKIDKHIILKSKKIQVYYYYVLSGHKKCFLQLIHIVPTEKGDVKHNFTVGMSEQTIRDFCGKPFYENTHKRNYELCYDSASFKTPGQVNFSFDGKTKKLTAINLWSGLD
ncbi:hypothetical protein H0R92_06540 [Treponema sp. OMZ 840]|uniref:hypothetical protein n=1 Tax=Treponema sp. OMZ 840 TaxID=244313 RepID=UPI003D90EBB5